MLLEEGSDPTAKNESGWTAWHYARDNGHTECVAVLSEAMRKLLDQLSDEQIAELQEAFALFDRDDDGFVTTDGIRVIMRSLGIDPAEAELADMIYKLDIDGNGIVGYLDYLLMVNSSEFHLMMARIHLGAKEMVLTLDPLPVLKVTLHKVGPNYLFIPTCSNCVNCFSITHKHTPQGRLLRD